MGADKRKQEEEELEQMLKEQRGETEEVSEEVEEENLQVQKKKHLKSVTLTFVGINKNKQKI